MKRELIGGPFDGVILDSALARLTLVKRPPDNDPTARATYHDYAERIGDPARMDYVSGEQTAAGVEVPA